MRRLVLASALLCGACSLDPKLARPALPIVRTFPLSNQTEPPSAAALDWRFVLADPRLQQLVLLALRNNRDLQISTLNVAAARAQFSVQRSAGMPALDVSGGYTHQHQPASVATAGMGGSAAPSTTAAIDFAQFTANTTLTSFEIDLFGRQRSLSRAAFERYLASAEGARAARIALIGAVADAYLAERLATEQLALARRTLADWRGSLGIARQLYTAKQASGIDLAQAEGQVAQAEADTETRTRTLAQSENLLHLLLGTEIPDDLPVAIPLMAQSINTMMPAGLPSDLLVNRPDIRQAEHVLAATNADIGAARAAFFPRLSLTTTFGVSSLALASLFTGASQSWSFAPQITQPIYAGGRLRGELRLTRIRKALAVAEYERAIQIAFREVVDGLAGRATFGRALAAQRGVVAAATRRVTLSGLRYKAGVDGRLELLDAQRNAYVAQQTQLELQREMQSSMVGLYRALGGGDAS